jgi:molybdate/tungstate transport system permease protein
MASGERRPTAGWAPRWPGWPAASAVLGGVLLLYYVLPLVTLVAAQRPAALAAALSEPGVAAAAAHSLLTATATTVLATAFGLPLAHWLARTDARARPLVEAAVTLPLVLPPTVAGVVVLSLVGPGTPPAAAAGVLGVELTRSLVGVVLAQTFVASPFVVITARAAFADVDPRLVEAARTQGATTWRILLRVTLPLAWPGILAGITLTFARALGEFGATLMLSYYPRTLPVAVWVAFLERGLSSAYPIAVLLLVLSLLALAVIGGLGRQPWE